MILHIHCAAFLPLDVEFAKRKENLPENFGLSQLLEEADPWKYLLLLLILLC